jgi:hypothetical protein
LSRSIVAALAESALPVDALYSSLPSEQRGAIRSAVLELALHEIVAIEDGGAR